MQYHSSMESRVQRTIRKEIVCRGPALFSSGEMEVRLLPAEPDTGVRFRRIDLPGAPEVRAATHCVQKSPLCTKVAEGDAVVQTIEHCMAALSACRVDNVIVEISGAEMPILDGSSLPWVQHICTAGVQPQAAPLKRWTLKEPCYVAFGDAWIAAFPSQEFRVSYTLHYPQSPYLGTQFFTALINPASFETEIAPSRTFALYEDVVVLTQQGVLKNGDLKHGVVVQGDQVLNPEGVRFPDEAVRHKVLDVIGDLALLAYPLDVHVIGVKTGHAANHALARMMMEKLCEVPHDA